ncbi:MAG: SDR family oxidoreductase [Immundisolibacteraceae bacterium]|nr:SDR family oxidoreductase [Immundisolibacteraceae bacterium]
MPNRLSNKVAIITGAANGIGRTAAELFAVEGAKVVLSDIDAGGADLAKQLQQQGLDVVWQPCNISNETEVAELIEATLSQYGQLDILYNNAGSEAGDGNLVDLTTDDWERLTNNNAKGVFLMCKHAVPALLASGGGAIVSTASIAGLIGGPVLHLYSANKAAIISLTRSVAATYGRHGIRANTICPGFVHTEMVARLGEGAIKAGEKMSLLGRGAQPIEIAQTALFLASDEASFITGVHLPVDGGVTAV